MRNKLILAIFFGIPPFFLKAQTDALPDANKLSGLEQLENALWYIPDIDMIQQGSIFYFALP